MLIKSTNLIILVRTYRSADPLFDIDRVVPDGDKATSLVKKLNEIVGIEKKDDGWVNKYYSTTLYLN